MIQPRCPFCRVEGLDKIMAKTVGHFSVVCCRQCGTIHGVVPAANPTSASTQSSPYSSPETLRSQQRKSNPEYVADRLRSQKRPIRPKSTKEHKTNPSPSPVVLDASLEGVVSYFFEDDAAA